MTIPAPGPGVVGRRVVQRVLDMLLGTVPVAVLAVLVVLYLRPAGSLLTFLEVVAYTTFGVWVVATLYLEIWWPYRHRGQTPAMRWLRIRVVLPDGGPPPLRAYVIRALLMVVDGFCWGLAGVVIMLVNPRRQRLGDLVAGTLVVSADEPGLPGPDGDLGAVASPQLALGGREVSLHGGERQDE
ncbi:RDD family protein [Amycolatopsis rhabdoformis]|uniref:RDD family protein n=1 Tax=Amycolatopsis rhabdoformis TaxID=1448059 RepID=A0ABZ1I0D5_9PSEU|nr:RDD family protein [Amycolatopsis rhabdoformis]WSE27665.1 RDD family protein [Amycolatopsis rhabdoformis]